ncbi:putative superfamily II DNA/RNA helicase [Vibrio chagasii]|nr:putative superfamily II DNA/RNA helicase [Vibrio chagasii]
MELRDYQAATIGGLFSWWKENGNTPAVVVLPTAAGKTIVFSALIKNLKESFPRCRVLILSHTKELVGQARDKLKTVWPSAPVGVYAAGLNERDIASDIISASRDSIARAVDKFPPFDLVIIDEAHLINNKNEGRYRAIIAHFLAANPSAAIVGFTATPFRSGTAGGYIYGQDRLFKGVAHEVKMIELMRAGFLCKITAKPVDETGVIDTSKVATKGGDFCLGQLAKVSEDSPQVKLAVDDWKTKAYDNGRRSNCFFAVSVAHAEMIQKAVLAVGVECGLVTGETPQDERDLTLARFESGDLPAIVNIATLTTGWDAPRLDCIVLLRPTKSLVLYLQIIGRGLRLHESKQNTLVLDYGENLERFGAIDQASPAEKRKAAPKVQVCEHCESLVNFYAFTCPECNGQLKEKPRKVCDHCGTECAPSCTKCPACGSLFLTHKGQAEFGAIISTEDDIRQYDVERITANPAKSRKTGRAYLQIWFWASIETKFKKNVFIGWPGNIGQESDQFWQWLTNGNLNDPANPGHAARMLNECGHLAKPIKSVQIDHKSKYKDIIRIDPR